LAFDIERKLSAVVCCGKLPVYEEGVERRLGKTA